jgi:hypothetical protein
MKGFPMFGRIEALYKAADEYFESDRYCDVCLFTGVLIPGGQNAPPLRGSAQEFKKHPALGFVLRFREALFEQSQLFPMDELSY